MDYKTKIRFLSLLMIVAIACNQPISLSKKDTIADDRPNTQVSFMRKLKGISDRSYEFRENSILADKVADSLTSYALDSLKNVKDWQLIVQEITNDEYNMSKTGELLFSGMSVYNVKMASVLDIQEQARSKADTLAIDNYVTLTYTVPQKPKGEALKKQLDIISSLSVGDTVLVSGGVVMLNAQYKPDFSKMVENLFFIGSDLDFLVTAIAKK